jgi:Spy/CpxP family protein refolding chaperone
MTVMRTAPRLGALALAALVGLAALGGHACPAAAAPATAPDSPCPGHQGGAQDPSAPANTLPQPAGAQCAMACGGGALPVVPAVMHSEAVVSSLPVTREQAVLPFVLRLPDPVPIA